MLTRILFFLTFYFLIFSACKKNNIADVGDSLVEPTLGAYTWRVYNFEGIPDPIDSFQINENDEVFAYTEHGMYYAKNIDESFNAYPFTNDFRFGAIKNFNKYYALATVIDMLVINDEGDTIYRKTNAIARSNDLINWDLVRGKFYMYDYIYDETKNILHIARQHGTLSVNLTTGEEFDERFLYSRLDDKITSLVIDKDGNIYAASHDGVYFSEDDGRSWKKSFSRVSKNYDSVRKLIRQNGKIVGLGYRNIFEFDNPDYNRNIIHVLEEGADVWEHWFVDEKEENGSIKHFEAESFNIDAFNRVVLTDYRGLFISTLQNSEPFVFAGPFTDEETYPLIFDDSDTPIPYRAGVFSNGDILISNSKYSWYGKRNSDFEF